MRVTDPALAGPKGNPLALHVSAGHLNLCLYPWGSYRIAEPESASVPPSPLLSSPQSLVKLHVMEKRKRKTEGEGKQRKL